MQRRKTEDAMTVNKSFDKARSQSKDDELAYRSKTRTLIDGTTNKQASRTSLLSTADTLRSVLSEKIMGKTEPEPEPPDSKQGDDPNPPAEEEKAPEIPKTWQDYFRFALPHIALVTATSLYCVGGASIFFAIEQPHEIQVKSTAVAKVHEAQLQLMDRLWAMLQNKSTTFAEYCRN